MHHFTRGVGALDLPACMIRFPVDALQTANKGIPQALPLSSRAIKVLHAILPLDCGGDDAQPTERRELHVHDHAEIWWIRHDYGQCIRDYRSAIGINGSGLPMAINAE
jgi:hypothetical protein